MIEDFLASFVSGQEQWWVYCLALFLPLCVFLSIREAICWFFKVNKLVNRLERIERAILDGRLPSDSVSEDEDEEYQLAPAPRRGPSEL